MKTPEGGFLLQPCRTSFVPFDVGQNSPASSLRIEADFRNFLSPPPPHPRRLAPFSLRGRSPWRIGGPFHLLRSLRPLFLGRSRRGRLGTVALFALVIPGNHCWQPTPPPDREDPYILSCWF